MSGNQGSRQRKYSSGKEDKLGFHTDLAFGEAGERYAISKLRATKVRKMDGNFCSFDYIVNLNNNIELYEVKTDRLAKTTGNIAVEHKCFINTKADYWLFVLYPKVYKVPVSMLKKWIDCMMYSTIVMGGDNNQSVLFLFPKEILDPFIILDESEAC